MHATMQHVVAVGFFAAAALAGPLFGCAKEKVDCKVFCDKEAECIGDVMLALKATTKDKVKSLSKDEIKFLGDKQRDRCMTSCNDPKKPEAIDKKWNGCLKKSGCSEFATCVYEGTI